MSQAGRWLARGAVALAAITFVIQWLLPRLRKWYRLHQSSSPAEPDSAHPLGETNNENEVQIEQQQMQLARRQDLQEKHKFKAASYKERILGPREEAKKLKKEEEFFRFLGPAWKGRGQALGSEENHTAEQEELDAFEKELNPREMSAVRRRIQKPTPQPPKPTKKPKRVIQLPDEPDEGDAESVLVLLRSPVHTVFQRRFRQSHTVQTLLDFMTMSGFNQAYNTLCTSYPRRDIGTDKETTLEQLAFSKRVTLNIEEKDMG